MSRNTWRPGDDGWQHPLLDPYSDPDRPKAPQVAPRGDAPKHILGPDGNPIHTVGRVRFGFQPSERKDDR